MTQKLAFYLDRIPDVVAALTRDGFAAQSAKRNVPGLTVRLREGTEDESRASEVVEEMMGRTVRRGPSGSPTVHLEGYHEGL